MKNENYPLYEVESISSLKEMLEFAAKKYGNNPAFAFERNKEDMTISYNQFKADTEALGAALLDLGINRSKISVLGDNSYEWILTYFATVNSGNIIVPLDKELSLDAIKNLIEHSETEAFVYSNAYSDIADYLQENGAKIKHYINTDSLPELLERGNHLIQQGEKDVANIEIDNNDLMAILYTSGTTGLTKGVMLSHKGLAENTVGSCQNVLFQNKGFLILPLHHVAGFISLLSMLYYGVAVAINLNIKNLQSDFLKYKPNITVLVPLYIETFYKQINKMATKTNEPLKKVAKLIFGENLDTIISGGAVLDGKYVKRYRDLGITIINVYGLTETSACISTNRNNYYNDDSVGLVLSNCKVKITEPDENGHGDICVKGDIVMLGYYKNEQATKEAFDGEWFNTGDIGYFDDDGFLYICGRKKNVIILNNGKNVYPEELEFALVNQIPYIKEVVVYAEDTIIIAEVFLDIENNPDCVSQLSNDILNFNQTQSFYKNIGKTVIRDMEFDKTTTRKIKRKYK